MKKLLLILSFALPFFLACKKDHPLNPKSPEKLLTAKIWQIKKITSAQSSTLLKYERGGSNNNADFSMNYLDFNEGGTGTYKDGFNEYVISWEFTNSDKTELAYEIKDYANGQPVPGYNMTVQLENINIAPEYFRYAEIYTNENGVSAVSSVFRIPYSSKVN